MSVTLKALSEGPDLILNKPVLLLGRHEECDVQLHSSKVSRRHCIIAFLDDRVLIRDLGSTNGVRINGETVTEAPIKDGDEVAIGNFCYRVKMDSTARPRLQDEELEAADEPVALSDEIDHESDTREPEPVAKKAALTPPPAAGKPLESITHLDFDDD